MGVKKVAHFSPPASLDGVGILEGSDLVVSERHGVGRNVYADDGVGGNNRVIADSDASHDHRPGIDDDMVLQRWIVSDFTHALTTSADRNVLIDRDVPSDLDVAANDDADRVRKVHGIQITEWNLAAQELLQRSPQSCESSFQCFKVSFRVLACSCESILRPFGREGQPASSCMGLNEAVLPLWEGPIS